jgi:hypothetical protein
VHEERWGTRRLAYPVKKGQYQFLEGNYHLTRFATEGAFNRELENFLKLDENVLRSLVTTTLPEEELAAHAAQTRAPRPPRAPAGMPPAGGPQVASGDQPATGAAGSTPEAPAAAATATDAPPVAGSAPSPEAPAATVEASSSDAPPAAEGAPSPEAPGLPLGPRHHPKLRLPQRKLRRLMRRLPQRRPRRPRPRLPQRNPRLPPRPRHQPKILSRKNRLNSRVGRE